MQRQVKSTSNRFTLLLIGCRVPFLSFELFAGVYEFNVHSEIQLKAFTRALTDISFELRNVWEL